MIPLNLSLQRTPAHRGGETVTVELEIIASINPFDVPEFVWLVATRRAPYPTSVSGMSTRSRDVRFAAILARYDRETASALVAPTVALAKQTPPAEWWLISTELLQAVAQLDGFGAVVHDARPIASFGEAEGLKPGTVPRLGKHVAGGGRWLLE